MPSMILERCCCGGAADEGGSLFAVGGGEHMCDGAEALGGIGHHRRHTTASDIADGMSEAVVGMYSHTMGLLTRPMTLFDSSQTENFVNVPTAHIQPDVCAHACL